jgi:uncharacterized protein YbjT (DUF2867 family)
MKVLLIGASGFLGSAIHSALIRSNNGVIASYHRAPGAALSHTVWQQIDMGNTSLEAWRPHLRGIEVVINCAGVLQDGWSESTQLVHVRGVQSLVEACEQNQVRRLIHFSAIGVDKRAVTDFARSKRAGEEIVIRSQLDWIILRPSVVLGEGAFGGSALIRGLAALPLLPIMPDTAEIQVVQRADVVRTVLHFVGDAPGRIALDLVGPDRVRFEEAVAMYRSWLGRTPARRLQLSQFFASFFYRLGDLARALGWRPPLGTTAQLEMAFGAIGNMEPWERCVGFTPQTLKEGLERRPATVQERWFAQLYLLKPCAIVVFSLFWMATGFISFTAGYRSGVNLMLEAGAGGLAEPSVIAGALADLVVGAAIAFRPTHKYGLYGALALSLFYFAAGSVLVPRLWAEPLGPLVKIWPILMLNLALLAIREDR